MMSSQTFNLTISIMQKGKECRVKLFMGIHVGIYKLFIARNWYIIKKEIFSDEIVNIGEWVVFRDKTLSEGEKPYVSFFYNLKHTNTSGVPKIFVLSPLCIPLYTTVTSTVRNAQ